ncbi:hypothetical protein E2562_007801 [Oryza meyeriana var. granulata]|uniref:Uncharacterized protein n=1 Tax=Oryza meyeriana var. granulata TaxID=110450 RepID=A0A6G1F541_9ORYZ|nr:hypothetical protein E2562_007801 [Oryza meyeriana var. granulata]
MSAHKIGGDSILLDPEPTTIKLDLELAIIKLLLMVFNLNFWKQWVRQLHKLINEEQQLVSIDSTIILSAYFEASEPNQSSSFQTHAWRDYGACLCLRMTTISSGERYALKKDGDVKGADENTVQDVAFEDGTFSFGRYLNRKLHSGLISFLGLSKNGRAPWEGEI